MISGLLPSRVATAESFGDPEPLPVLFPEEEAHVARAVDRRRREFATVRHLAREALARQGGPRVALLPGHRGAPRWPEGFTGSMTHCEGYRAAAVVRADDGQVAAVGIDAEPDLPLPSAGVLEMVTLPEERPHLVELAARWPAVSWQRLLFSAKESVYKAWFPLTGRWLDFSEAVVELTATGPGSGTFTARLLVPGPVVNGVRLPGFTGRWAAADGLLATAIAVTVPAAPAAPAAPPMPSAGVAE